MKRAKRERGQRRRKMQDQLLASWITSDTQPAEEERIMCYVRSMTISDMLENARLQREAEAS